MDFFGGEKGETAIYASIPLPFRFTLPMSDPAITSLRAGNHGLCHVLLIDHPPVVASDPISDADSTGFTGTEYGCAPNGTATIPEIPVG